MGRRPMMNNTHLFIPDEFKDKRVLVTVEPKALERPSCAALVMAGPLLLRLLVLLCRRNRSPRSLCRRISAAWRVSRSLPTASLNEWGGIDILVNCVGGSDTPNGGYAALTKSTGKAH